MGQNSTRRAESLPGRPNLSGTNGAGTLHLLGSYQAPSSDRIHCRFPRIRHHSEEIDPLDSESLPHEILAVIASFLCTPDFFSFLLTSRATYDLIHHSVVSHIAAPSGIFTARKLPLSTLPFVKSLRFDAGLRYFGPRPATNVGGTLYPVHLRRLLSCFPKATTLILTSGGRGVGTNAWSGSVRCPLSPLFGILSDFGVEEEEGGGGEETAFPVLSLRLEGRAMYTASTNVDTEHYLLSDLAALTKTLPNLEELRLDSRHQSRNFCAVPALFDVMNAPVPLSMRKLLLEGCKFQQGCDPVSSLQYFFRFPALQDLVVPSLLHSRLLIRLGAEEAVKILAGAKCGTTLSCLSLEGVCVTVLFVIRVLNAFSNLRELKVCRQLYDDSGVENVNLVEELKESYPRMQRFEAVGHYPNPQDNPQLEYSGVVLLGRLPSVRHLVLAASDLLPMQKFIADAREFGNDFEFVRSVKVSAREMSEPIEFVRFWNVVCESFPSLFSFKGDFPLQRTGWIATRELLPGEEDRILPSMGVLQMKARKDSMSALGPGWVAWCFHHFPNLRRVNLSDCGLVSLRKLASLCNVRKLNICRNRIRIDDFCRFLSKTNCLEVLLCDESALCGKIVDEPESIPVCQTLSRLSLVEKASLLVGDPLDYFRRLVEAIVVKMPRLMRLGLIGPPQTVQPRERKEISQFRVVLSGFQGELNAHYGDERPHIRLE